MQVILSPYAHELHYSGKRCADDCPACRWVDEQEQAEKARQKKPVRPSSRFEEVTSVMEESEIEQPA
jgi:hypothetical protein